MAEGTIRTITDRGFGFIQEAGATKDVFFHHSALVDVTIEQLRQGDRVTFTAEADPRAKACAPGTCSWSSPNTGAQDSALPLAGGTKENSQVHRHHGGPRKERDTQQSPEGDPPVPGLLGEGVLITGVDQGAARRAHMRGLTMARQAAERARDRARVPQLPATATTDERRAARQQAAREAAATADTALQTIEATHQAWLEAQETARQEEGPH